MSFSRGDSRSNLCCRIRRSFEPLFLAPAKIGAVAVARESFPRDLPTNFYLEIASPRCGRLFHAERATPNACGHRKRAPANALFIVVVNEKINSKWGCPFAKWNSWTARPADISCRQTPSPRTKNDPAFMLYTIREAGRPPKSRSFIFHAEHGSASRELMRQGIL